MRGVFYFTAMAKIAEIIYDVREALKEYTNDSNISDEYILYLYNNKRVKFLRQELNNLQRTPDISSQQTLCLSTELVSAEQCGITTCEKILKSKNPLPKLIDLHIKSSIINVKPTKRISIPFNFVNKERVYFADYSPFKNALLAYLDTDNHIYIYSPKDDLYKMIECISVTAVFENPLELTNYVNCCGCQPNSETVCFDEFLSNYPLSAHLIDVIKAEIVNELANLKQLPQDKTNNSDEL